jgi:hypothetical protein
MKYFFTLFIIMGLALNIYGAPPKGQMYYEIKIYRISSSLQESKMDAFLKDAYIPAVHRAGIKTVGVFKPVEADTAFGKIVYVFIPFNTLDQYMELEGKLESDATYKETGKAFLDAPVKEAPFNRYESIFMRAFSGMPVFRIPSYTTPPAARIYELRSYESATEAKAAKKIHMFNEGGEIGIFEKVGSNAVFYGQVLFGSLKPRLMYMTTYADMKSHDEHWAAFRVHPDWMTLKAKEEYQSTTSKTNPYLLHPTSYSDF